MVEYLWHTDDALTYFVAEGEHYFIEIDDTPSDTSQFNIEFESCDYTYAPGITGEVFFDSNDNGVRDLGEMTISGQYLLSDPIGIYAVTNEDGTYSSTVEHLDDGVYEVYPFINEDYWRISSDSLVYTILVDDDFEVRDSLDFGLYPDSLVHEVTPDLTGNFPRCNDTITYWLNVKNTGTYVVSGLIDLELDDSLDYVMADILPDSVVGQHIYWSYEDLFYFDDYSIAVQIGTPDGLDDEVLSTLNVIVDSAEVEVFADSYILEQTIVCAYDPNDKTPTPLGEGEFGYIDPDTESIEYLIRFQNTGTDTAFTVVIKDQLDENLDWNSFIPLTHSHAMNVEMNADGEVSFIFDNIMLPDSNVNEAASHGFVKYRINLKPDLLLGTSIFNTAEIYFDLNPAVITNTTVNTLHVDDVGFEEMINEQQLTVYPNPFNESITIFSAESLNGYSVHIVDVLGQEVYVNNQLNGNKLGIETEFMKQGVYVLLLVDNSSNQTVSTVKLIAR